MTRREAIRRLRGGLIGFDFLPDVGETSSAIEAVEHRD